MATPTLESIIEQIDQLTPDDQHRIVEHITQKRTTMIYTVPGDKMKEILDIF